MNNPFKIGQFVGIYPNRDAYENTGGCNYSIRGKVVGVSTGKKRWVDVESRIHNHEEKFQTIRFYLDGNGSGHGVVDKQVRYTMQKLSFFKMYNIKMYRFKKIKEKI